jgi:hypothetical protein
VDGSIVVEKVKNGKGAFGFNAATEEYEDLVKAGVIDPTKVVRTALQNAASVASLMLTTEASGGREAEEEVGGRSGGEPARRRAPRRLLASRQIARGRSSEKGPARPDPAGPTFIQGPLYVGRR